MRKISLYLLLSLFVAFTACDDKDDNNDLLGNWVSLNGFDGPAVSNAVSFTIGDSAYICTGYNGESNDHYNFLWVYIPDKDYWQERAQFVGPVRSSAVGFGTSTHGYVGLGADNLTEFNDFYEYDPLTNTWDTIAKQNLEAANRPTPRYDAIAFSINNKGYIGSGYDGDGTYLKDLWEYDPSTGNWTQKTSVPGDKKKGASVFVIDGKAYVCGGLSSGSYSTYFHSYDPESDSWTELHELDNVDDESFDDDYKEIPRVDAAAFAVGGKGYLVAGSNGTALSSTWEYDPSRDRWEEKTSLEKKGVKVARTSPIAFVVKDVGYVGTGVAGTNSYYDTYKFEPFKDENEED